mmetsp:Transcript_16651/g.63333  ORF Transcript_16651/g.63333 Transcript_16651/m.63333 type:complete len:326 (-) Transcript_16651:1630-2607(-)
MRNVCSRLIPTSRRFLLMFLLICFWYVSSRQEGTALASSPRGLWKAFAGSAKFIRAPSLTHVVFAIAVLAILVLLAVLERRVLGAGVIRVAPAFTDTIVEEVRLTIAALLSGKAVGELKVEASVLVTHCIALIVVVAVLPGFALRAFRPLGASRLADAVVTKARLTAAIIAARLAVHLGVRQLLEVLDKAFGGRLVAIVARLSSPEANPAFSLLVVAPLLEILAAQVGPRKVVLLVVEVALIEALAAGLVAEGVKPVVPLGVSRVEQLDGVVPFAGVVGVEAKGDLLGVAIPAPAEEGVDVAHDVVQLFDSNVSDVLRGRCGTLR